MTTNSKVPKDFHRRSSATPTPPVLECPWALLLGANEARVKDQPGVEVPAKRPAEEGRRPLLVVGGFGNGSTLVWTSDIGPHWLPASYVGWPGYRRRWNALSWAARLT
jgi:uncharacterized membrane protein